MGKILFKVIYCRQRSNFSSEKLKEYYRNIITSTNSDRLHSKSSGANSDTNILLRIVDTVF